MKRRVICILTAVAATVSAFSGCSFDDEKTYAFIGKDKDNQYMQKVYEGLSASCEELGHEAVFMAPDPKGDVVAQQIAQVKELIASKVSGIAISANDAQSLHDVLHTAESAGIKIVSVDSAVSEDCRSLHIGQTNAETVSRVLMDAVYDMCDKGGKYAILSTTEDAPNQAAWLSGIEKLNESDAKYAKLECVAIEYGNDDAELSAQAVERLMQLDGVEVILSPTTVGMAAAGAVLTNSQSQIKLTGLGLPSEMSEYIENGVCPKMYMWNPEELGYLAGYTISAIGNGRIAGKVGERFDAGKLGSKVVTDSLAGGTEVSLGDLSEFNAENIDKWKHIY